MTRKRVVPAILTEDPAALLTMVRQAETFTDYVQIDIMDGKFVPSSSITWQDIARVVPRLGWEAHLMVVNPEEQFEGFKKAGAKKVIFHFEATREPAKVVASARKLGLRVGLAINPETTVASFAGLAHSLDSVLFMSVHPGFYGAKFLPEVLDKVREFRRIVPSAEIGIDGGIKESNIIQVAASGVDTVCVGSAIFLQSNPGEAFRRLSALMG